MIEKKDKYILKTYCNQLKPVVLIGKEGLTANMLESIRLVLNKRELIKISILKTYTDLTTKELAELLASSTSSEIINIIGRTIVLYKKNEKINAYGI